MTYELPELFQLIRLSEVGVSHVSDNVVVLQYLRHQSEVRRTLTVLKTRASLHQPRVREFTITPEGITLQADDAGAIANSPAGPRSHRFAEREARPA
jgi:circadian clock protein KaiC